MTLPYEGAWVTVLPGVLRVAAAPGEGSLGMALARAIDRFETARMNRSGWLSPTQRARTIMVPTMPASLCPGTVQKNSYVPAFVGVNSKELEAFMAAAM